jgi:hypothetical protein
VLAKRFGWQNLPRNADRFHEGAVNTFSALICVLALSTGARAAAPPVVDAAVPIPPVTFDSAGNLSIKASATSSSSDFDFLVGHWKLTNKKLKCRLNGCTEWSAPFESYVDMEKVLAGAGNLDKYHEEVAGKRFDGLALRLFDPQTRFWSIYWADGNRGTLDPPVVGSFENGVGHFFGRDTFEGREIIVVFRWDVRDPHRPIWSQAFSPDRGKSWEWNSINVSERIKP